MSKELKLAPYGEPSFEELRNPSYAYVDKTRFIETLEQCGTRFPFIVRPRRFGKSVFANMLMAYYDKAAKDDFSKNFAGTWIGKHPTSLANKYLVLMFDFSGIDGGDDIVQNFIENIKSSMEDFAGRYLEEDSDIHKILDHSYDSPATLMTKFTNLIIRRFRNDKIYLIIDEYDQFAQEVLTSSPERFRSMTSKDGFLKTFYANIKRLCKTVIKNVFITGVTSISLDSMTSGFNVATNISNESDFSCAMGFTDEELLSLIPQIVNIEQYGYSIDEIFDRMKVLYDGYRFSPQSNITVFNASMCLYYLKAIAKDNCEPANLLDPSFSIDLSKIEGILSLGDKKFVDDVVTNVLVNKPIVIGALSGAINLNMTEELSNDDLLTALVFMGFLTFAPNNADHLVCPNVAVKELFFKYWFRRIGKANILSFPSVELRKMMKTLETGNIEPFLSFVSNRLTQCVGSHAHGHLNEMAIQLAVCMAVNTAWNYKVTAEEEAFGAGFTDLILRPNERNQDTAGWVIEFKYLKKSEATQGAVDAKIAEAEAQLKRYSTAENIANIPNLRRAAVVFSGTDLKGLKVF